MTNAGRRARRHRRPLRLLLSAPVLLCAAAGTSLPARAADWSGKGRISQTVDYSDNLNRDPDSEGDAYGSKSALTFDLLATEPTVAYGLAGDLGFSRYWGAGATDSFDGPTLGLSATLAKKFKTTDVDLSASLRAAPAGVDELEDSGLTEVDTTRITYSLGAGVTRRIDDANSLSWDAGWSMADFTRSTDSLTPFTSLNTSTSWTRQATRLTSYGLTLGGQYFNADNEENRESVSGRLTGFLATRLTPRLSVSASAGGGLVHNEFRQVALPGRPEDTTLSTSFLGDLNVAYALKNLSLTLAASQSFEPSSLGELQKRSAVNLGATYRLNSKTAFSFAASLSLQKSQGDGEGTDRTLITLSPALTYGFARHWNASLGYTFIYEDETVDDAISNTVSLTVSRDLVWLP